MAKLKYELTLLNAAVITAYLFLSVYVFVKWEELSKGDAYGIVALGLVVVLILSALIIDIILQSLVTNKKAQNSIGSIFILIISYLIILNS